MGFLSGLLTAIAIVATVVTGGALGIVAGALIATSYAASQGWIGGSVGKFFNSGIGKGLVMAVGLASAATSIMSNASSLAPVDTSSAVAKATANAEQGASTIAATDAAGGAAGGAANMASGAANIAGADATLASATPSGTMAMTMTDAKGWIVSLQGGNPNITQASGLLPGQISFAQNSADQIAQSLGFAGAGSNIPTGSVPNASQALGINQTAQTTANSNMASQTAVNPAGSSNVTTGAAPTTQPTAAPTAAPATAGAADAPQSGISGLLSKGMSLIDKHPGIATVGGNMLSGLANGMAQQKSIEEQIAANQWGNYQWQDPKQIASLQAAAAAPIQVPTGYLSRAAAVRNLMNGNTNQTTPLQGGPTAPAPAQPTVPPLGMAAGPVPPAAMPVTPRGGM